MCREFVIINLSRWSTLQPIRDNAAEMMLSHIPNSKQRTAQHATVLIKTFVTGLLKCWLYQCFTPCTQVRYSHNSWRDWPRLTYLILMQKTNIFNMCYTDASISVRNCTQASLECRVVWSHTNLYELLW